MEEEKQQSGAQGLDLTYHPKDNSPFEKSIAEILNGSSGPKPGVPTTEAEFRQAFMQPQPDNPLQANAVNNMKGISDAFQTSQQNKFKNPLSFKVGKDAEIEPIIKPGLNHGKPEIKELGVRGKFNWGQVDPQISVSGQFKEGHLQQAGIKISGSF
ncbi:MAG: hypothetical protein K1X66_08270 [Verrucomicrobiae bacterium]|nr:hypothetical protein [Verrucomicrobiae bacterium]